MPAAAMSGVGSTEQLEWFAPRNWLILRALDNLVNLIQRWSNRVPSKIGIDQS